MEGLHLLLKIHICSRTPNNRVLKGWCCRGIRWHALLGKWEAQIFNGARQVSLGYHDSEAQASVAFNAAAMQLRSAARPNFAPTP